MTIPNDAALLIVDVQNDFCPGGSLTVPAGDRVIPALNQAAAAFAAAKRPIFASRDWHPPQSRHFASGGGLWPVHCVAGTPGAEFHPALRLPAGTIVVAKGLDPEADDYSAFSARSVSGLLLPDLLRAVGICSLFIGGLATDYCVRATTLDACAAGFKVIILSDGIAGVEVQSGDTALALAAMCAAGATLLRSEEL